MRPFYLHDAACAGWVVTIRYDECVIDSNGRFAVEGLAGVSVFRDSGIANGYYALPDSPRLAVDESGKPQINLTLYGTRSGMQFQATGGLFACTTSLSLLARERQWLDDAMPRRAGKANTPVLTQRLHTLWVNGASALRVGEFTPLAAEPSLYGDNTSVFQMSLNQSEARLMEEAWASGLRDTQARYTLTGPAGSGEFRFEGSLDTHSHDLSLLISRVVLP